MIHMCTYPQTNGKVYIHCKWQMKRTEYALAIFKVTSRINRNMDSKYQILPIFRTNQIKGEWHNILQIFTKLRTEYLSLVDPWILSNYPRYKRYSITRYDNNMKGKGKIWGLLWKRKIDFTAMKQNTLKFFQSCNFGMMSIRF